MGHDLGHTPFGHVGERTLNEILKNVVILSLTRTPLNALMWAHYGEEHKGFVIGYDVDDQFFKCKTNNLIPIQQGNVIYTKTKPIINISEFFLNELDNHIKGLFKVQKKAILI